jgi:hypothetical protein
MATIPGAKHWPHAKQPAALAALLREFVATLPAPQSTPDQASQEGWRGASASKSSAGFAARFAPDVTLEAAVLVRVVRGRETVSQVPQQASSIYCELQFTHQASVANRTCMERRAVTDEGVKVNGITVLVKDADGQIVEAAIHHRPLLGVVRFSAELRDRVGGDS